MNRLLDALIDLVDLLLDALTLGQYGLAQGDRAECKDRNTNHQEDHQ